NPCCDVLRQHITCRVGAVDAVGTVALHETRLHCKLGGLDDVSHHQKPDSIETELAGERDVLFGNVCLGAMRGDVNCCSSTGVRHVKMLDRANSWKQQH